MWKRWLIRFAVVASVVQIMAWSSASADEEGRRNQNARETTIVVLDAARGTYVVDVVRTPMPWMLRDHVRLAEDGTTIVSYDRVAKLNIRGRIEALVRSGRMRTFTPEIQRSMDLLSSSRRGAAAVETTEPLPSKPAQCGSEERCLSTICIPQCGQGEVSRTCGLTCSDCTWITICS